MRPITYRGQKACINCKWSWDGSDAMLYCRRDGTKRPEDKSYGTREGTHGVLVYQRADPDERWKWDQDHVVAQMGICQSYESKLKKGKI